MKQAIFLGSFDPVHLGHFNVINSFYKQKDKYDVDKIHILPTHQNPNKLHKALDFWHRFNMCELIFKPLKDVKIDALEELHQFTYTYDLMKLLKSEKHLHSITSNFYWILTTETFQEILDNKWYKSEYFLQNIPMIIMSYDPIEWKTKYPNYEFCQIDDNNCKYIHSTYIRQKIKENKPITNEVGFDVENYIDENKLYTIYT